MTKPAWLNELNTQQHDVVVSPLGNHLVLAGAGSGKTRVLVSRMAFLMSNMQLPAHALLAVTFTNKAALEMKSRLQKMQNGTLNGLWVGTFHGICHRLLCMHHAQAGLPEHFHVLDSDDQSRMIKRVMGALNLDLEQWPVKQAQSFINKHKDDGTRPQHLPVTTFGTQKTWISVYSAYERACQTAGVVDFAEILLRTHEMLRENKELLAHYQQRFQAILVDEFQDTNTVQYAWIRLLAGTNASVMAVGDDDQSIYGWRGAKIQNIQKFTSEFNACTVTRLEQNYRSSATILGAANALIAQNETRMGKQLWTESPAGEKIDIFRAFNELDEARFVSDFIRKERINARSMSEIAILYRSNAQSRVFEDALLRENIPYQIHGGVRFFERSEIKDTLAYLRLTVNPNDDTVFERVVNRPTRGIGDKTIQALRIIATNEQCSLWDSAKKILNSTQLTTRAAKALRDFINLIESATHEINGLPLDEQLNYLLENSGLYESMKASKTDLMQSKVDNVNELLNAAKEFQDAHNPHEDMPVLVAFLTHAALESGDQKHEQLGAAVHLMTLHAAKGLEFPLVFMVGLEEGIFPSRLSVNEPNKLEEERRLCYVGITRAMEHLVISMAETRRQYGREEQHLPSRFLRELPGALLHEVRAPMHKKTNEYRFVHTPPSDCGFYLGQNVRHQTFGSGVVLSMSGQGEQTRVQVEFNEHGSKWLSLAYAKLTADVGV